MMIWRKNMASNKNKKNKLPVSVKKATGKKSWWNKKKVIAASVIGAAILAAIVFLTVVIATTVFPIASSEEESRVVGHVGEYEVKYEELRYVVLLNQHNLDVEVGKYEELSDADKEKYEALLEERVLEDIKSNYVILTLCDKYGIKTDSFTLRMQVQEEIQAFVDENFGGSVSRYKAELKENGLTDSFLRFTFRVSLLEMELQEYFVENKIDIEYDETNFPEFVEYVMESGDWARTIHVFYPALHPYTDEEKRASVINSLLSQSTFTEEQRESLKVSLDDEFKKQADDYNKKGAKAYALETVELMKAEKNDESRFAAFKKRIGTAPTMVAGLSMDSSVSGIYFTYGQMGEAYETDAFALEEYAVGNAVCTEEGYYVIMRLPLEEEDVKLKAETLLAQYHYAALKKHMDASREEIAFVGNEYFGGISLIDVK